MSLKALVVVPSSCSLVYVCMYVAVVQQDCSVHVSTYTEAWSDFLPRVDSKGQKINSTFH